MPTHVLVLNGEEARGINFHELQLASLLTVESIYLILSPLCSAGFGVNLKAPDCGSATTLGVNDL